MSQTEKSKETSQKISLSALLPSASVLLVCVHRSCLGWNACAEFTAEICLTSHLSQLSSCEIAKEDP
jgi:hypothetical protein